MNIPCRRIHHHRPSATKDQRFFVIQIWIGFAVDLHYNTYIEDGGGDDGCCLVTPTPPSPPTAIKGFSNNLHDCRINNSENLKPKNVRTLPDPVGNAPEFE